MYNQFLSHIWAHQDEEDNQGTGEPDSKFKCVETTLLSLWTLFNPAGELHAGFHVGEDVSPI